jgi:hypothetical protein
MSIKPNFDDITVTSSIVDESKTWPRNKPPGDANDVLKIIVEAARRAYSNKAGGYQFDEDGVLLGGMGDIATECGDMMFNHDGLLCHIGAGITHGIAELVGGLDEDTEYKIRRLVQVAVGGGYLSALLDNKSADKRFPNQGNAKKSENKNTLAEKVKQYALDNPDATQKQMAKVFGKSDRTIRQYLNN